MYGSLRRKRHEEYKSMVRDKVVEAEWKYLDVNEYWQQMKNIMMETAQVTCGLSKDPCRHYLCMFPVAMAWSFSGSTVIHCVLPVLWMMSCFHIMA